MVVKLTVGAALTVTARVGQLGPGTYTGRIVVSAAGAANSPQSIPVTFRVRDPGAPALRLSPASLGFSAPTEGAVPPSQRVDVSNAGEGNLSWRLQVFTYNGGSWLTASPDSGSGPGAIIVSVDPRGLTKGSYAGRITVTADGAYNSPSEVPVSLAVQIPPSSSDTPAPNSDSPARTFDNRGIVNAATFLTSFLAPGQIATVFGSRLGPKDGVSFKLDPATGKVPQTLAGTRVTFDGISAPLFFVSYEQINLRVPFELAGRSSARVVLSAEGLDSMEAMLPLREASPGVFTTDGVRAAVLNQDATRNLPENPAAPGSIVQLFLTGQGVLDPPIETGALAPSSSPFPAPVLPVRVTMNGIEARVLFAGAAPGFAASPRSTQRFRGNSVHRTKSAYGFTWALTQPASGSPLLYGNSVRT